MTKIELQGRPVLSGRGVLSICPVQGLPFGNWGGGGPGRDTGPYLPKKGAALVYSILLIGGRGNFTTLKIHHWLPIVAPSNQ